MLSVAYEILTSLKCQNIKHNFKLSPKPFHLLIELNKRNEMIFTLRKLFVGGHHQSTWIVNRIFNNHSKSFTNRVRPLHILQNSDLSLVGLCRVNDALKTLQILSCPPNQILHTSIRFKSNKRNRRSNRNDSDEDDDDDTDRADNDDEERSHLDEFRDGDKSSDRNLTEVKVQTLR